MAKKQRKRSHRQWRSLDNAAKIFPVSSGESDTKVFRFACELKEEIQLDILQEAVEKTVAVFPFFRSVIRHGLFWYYLEQADKRIRVKEEYRSPCSPIYDPNDKKLLFEVTYYKKRINLEVYHALTDGTGAMHFLQRLIMNYLKIAHADELKNVSFEEDYHASTFEKENDSFKKYYQEAKKIKMVKEQKKRKSSYRFRGQKVSEHGLKIIEGSTEVKPMLDAAKSYETTLTIYVTALVILSIYEMMESGQEKHPVVVKMPVNLRQYFPSASARNFFGIIEIVYDFSEEPKDLESIIASVHRQFKAELTQEGLAARIYKLGALEHNMAARVTPLVIKNIAMKIGYRISNKKFTFSISNVGKVEIPEAFRKYIEDFDVFLSTDKQQMCMCSYNGRLRMSFTSRFVSPELQMLFFRKIAALGIDVIIDANEFAERGGGDDEVL